MFAMNIIIEPVKNNLTPFLIANAMAILAINFFLYSIYNICIQILFKFISVSLDNYLNQSKD